MREMRDGRGRHSRKLSVLAAVVATFVLGCGSTMPSPPPSPSASLPSSWPYVPVCEPMTIRWFVGLGGGTSPDQIAAEKVFIKRRYENCNPTYISLEVVPNDQAYDKFKQEIAAGVAPDIIGPIGIRMRDMLESELLDLQPLVGKSTADLGDFESAAVDFFKDADGRQLGLPYTIYPGYLFYRKDLFAAASLPEPPHRVGETYLGREWNWETLAWVAERLTVDTHGRTVIEPMFDANKVVQYGFAFESADARRIASCFGGGSLVAADGRTSQIPAAWAQAWKWYYDAMWASRFAYAPGTNVIPEQPAGGWLSRGRIAAGPSWPWMLGAYEQVHPAFTSWDMAVMPSYGGRTSAPMDADTFYILKSTPHPEETYLAMLEIMADPGLMEAYGGMPARKSLQAAYFAALDAKLAPIFPGNKVDWSVLSEMSKYPAVPSHEADMPASDKSSQVLTAFLNRLETRRGLDVDAEILKLRRDLQAAFDQAAPTPAR